MNRQQKESLIELLSHKFTANEAAFVVRYQGLSVLDLQQLRRNLEKKDGEIKVAKNRLMKIAIEKQAGYLQLAPMMVGQSALVFSKSDFTSIAKVLNDFAKKNEELEIVAGFCESKLFDAAGVKRLALIPSREVLLARLCGTLQAPIAKLAYVLAQVVEQRTAPVVEALIEEQK